MTPTVDQIKRATCGAFNIERAAMTSRHKFNAYAHPRQAAMYLTRRLTARSYPEIGRLFGGRDHTTAIFAGRAVTARMESDPRFAVRVCIAEWGARYLASFRYERRAAE